jgi:hypothetical protein
VTWLDPKIGFEISAAPGFTFNGENPDTDYRGDIPVSTQLMWTHDFDVENRLEGNLGLLTVSLPLSGHSPAPADLE